MKIKIGTRGSKLALTQTNMVKNMIEEASPNVSCEIVVIKTKGDVDLKNPIHKVGKGVFVKEIEDSLLRGDIDLAVHSMK
ncbi:MAG: hydroxymethylbilane synthase, partial [Ezakiella coagulans]